jgi:hypothetical protein
MRRHQIRGACGCSQTRALEKVEAARAAAAGLLAMAQGRGSGQQWSLERRGRRARLGPPVGPGFSPPWRWRRGVLKNGGRIFFKKIPFHNPQLFTLIEFQPQRQNQHPRTMKTVRYLGWFSHMWHNRAHMSESTSPALLACLLSFPDLLFLVTVTSAPSRRTAPPLPEP